MAKITVRVPKFVAEEDQKKLVGPRQSKEDQKKRLDRFMRLFKDIDDLNKK